MEGERVKSPDLLPSNPRRRGGSMTQTATRVLVMLDVLGDPVDQTSGVNDAVAVISSSPSSRLLTTGVVALASTSPAHSTSRPYGLRRDLASTR